MGTSIRREIEGAEATVGPTAPLDQQVFAEQIALLHTRFAVAQVTVVLNALVVTALYWGLAPRRDLLGWFASICALAVARSLAVRAYGRRPRAPGEAARWGRIFVAGTALNGLAWGSAALLFWTPSSPAHQIFLAFVLGGMAAGAAASNASHAPAFAAFALPALLPMVARCGLERDPIHAAMAFMLTLFGLAVGAISRTGGRAIERSIRLRHRNDLLVEHLGEAQERLQGLNADLERRVAERTAELERMLALRRESEAHLARFRALLDQVGDAIFVARAEDLSVVDVNAGACALLGTGAEALRGRRLDEMGVAPSLSGPGARELLAGIEHGEVRSFEERRVDGGTPRFYEVSIAARAVDGRRYLLVVARDVSARREMENKLAQAGLLASVGSLAAGVAHEINNPLAYVLGNLEHLSGAVEKLPDRLPADREEMLEVIRESLEGAERVRRIVSDLGSLSPRPRSTLEAVDVGAVLDSCINVAMGEIRNRATLVREVMPVPPVLGDQTRLAQVFLNLLVNAAQAIPEGEPDAERIVVRTRYDPAAGAVEVEFSDTGEGIAPSLLDRIFEPFFTTKPIGHGSGLGLSICHGIVSSLGGRIGVCSREGEGSTFTVHLRAAQGAGDVRAPPASSARWQAG